ncbi:MAG: hypothetical protein U0174_07080 [Polyangiaceae bacterium]
MSTTHARTSRAPSWLLVLRPDGIVESVDGGTPAAWVARSIEDHGAAEVESVVGQGTVFAHTLPRDRP